MNGMNEENQSVNWTAAGSEIPTEQKPVAFCQNCGKPLTSETRRVVGRAVFCEPCLEARLSGNPGAGPIPNASYGPMSAGMTSGMPGGMPIGSSEPNPGLAALLGLIPGVGAMYNEQYAKGIVHLVVFAVLIMFAHVTDIFILFVFGWEFYMAIEAHHTAKARRDGTPLPNPFGFNDIGERMGFGRAWPSGPDVAGAARDAAQAAASSFQSGAWTRNPYSTPTPPPYATSEAASAQAAAAPPWGAPAEAYPYGPGYPQVPGSAAYAPPYGAPYVAPVAAPYMPGSGQTAYAVDPQTGAVGLPPMAASQSRFPAGAVWLIGLGTVFLLGTTGLFNGISGPAIVSFVLLGLGVWIFIRRMTDTGATLASDGTPGYQFRVLRALRGSTLLVMLGFLSLLDTFHLVSWHYSWPWIIIVVGVMMVLQRSIYNSAAYHAAYAAVPPQPYGPAYPIPGPAPVVPGPATEAPQQEHFDANDSSRGGK